MHEIVVEKVLPQRKGFVILHSGDVMTYIGGYEHDKIDGLNINCGDEMVIDAIKPGSVAGYIAIKKNGIVDKVIRELRS